MQHVNLGLLGSGTVGGGVYQALGRNGGLIASRLGIRIQIAKIAVRDRAKARSIALPDSLLTERWQEVAEDPQIPIVAELMGGTTLAKTAVLAALRLGKSVVTANKALLSAHGEELFEAAQKHRANLYYEASVAGGIPAIKVIRESFIGNRILRIYGIVNGTCNYILTRMGAEKLDFQSALAEAQRLGYAEAQASLDVDGHDAAQKMGILASLAHGFWVHPEQIHTEGIRAITPLDIEFSGQLGYIIKLLGIVKKIELPATERSRRSAGGPRVQVSVCPTLIPKGHVLASVNDVFNAVHLRGDVVGDTLFYGRGAGQDATASSVLSDLADAALDLKSGQHGRIPPFVPHECSGAVADFDSVMAPFYLRLTVIDKPGTLAKIAAILGRAKIGISSVIQPEGHEGSSVPLILMIHNASNAAMRRALTQIARLSVVKAEPMLLRVEHFE